MSLYRYSRSARKAQQVSSLAAWAVGARMADLKMPLEVEQARQAKGSWSAEQARPLD